MIPDLRRCPVCRKRKLEPSEVRNALARFDNKTELCSSCGTDEAMIDFETGKAGIANRWTKLAAAEMYREALQNSDVRAYVEAEEGYTDLAPLLKSEAATMLEYAEKNPDYPT